MVEMQQAAEVEVVEQKEELHEDVEDVELDDLQIFVISQTELADFLRLHEGILALLVIDIVFIGLHLTERLLQYLRFIS